MWQWDRYGAIYFNFIYLFTGLDMVHLIVQHVMFLSANLSSVSTVKPVFSDHIKQTYFWLFRPVGECLCCMKVKQKAHALLSFSNKQPRPCHLN